MTDGAKTAIGVVIIAIALWLLIGGTSVGATTPTPQTLPPPSVIGGGGIYQQSAHLLYTAITNPNAIQHAVGLAGTDGWGKGMFESGEYQKLAKDEQLYVTLSEAAYDCQQTHTFAPIGKCKMAEFILPGLAPCRNAHNGGCDFDNNNPLAGSGGHMKYLGNYQVQYSQGGTLHTGSMRQVDPPGFTESYMDWAKRVGAPITDQDWSNGQ
jgi:hypothetical protein